MTNDWTIDWVMFFDAFAADFHPTFQKKFAQQLFRKGSAGTGIKDFEKYNFQLIVGMKDLQMRVNEDKVFARIEFITPTSFSFPIDIYWSGDSPQNLLDIHKRDIENENVEINWGENFPIEKILPHLAEPMGPDEPD